MNYYDLEGMAQALFEGTGDALFLFDPESDQILDANATAQRLTGFSVAHLHHMKVTSLVHATSTNELDHFRRAAKKTTFFSSREGYFLQTFKEGVRIPVNLSVSRLHANHVVLGLITARDVRKQHEALERCQATEAEFRRVLASVSDCLWSAEVDAAGKWLYRYFSPVVERITGQPPEHFLPGVHRWWSVVHPEDQGRWTKALARQRAGQDVQEEYRVLIQDGAAVRWVRESVRASHDPKRPGVIRLDGVITDITPQRKADQSARAWEGRFQAFLDHSPAMAFFKDTAGRYIYANPSFHRLAPGAAGPVTGKTDADVLPAELGTRLQENAAAALAANQPGPGLELRPTGAGSQSPWLVVQFPFQDGSGQRFVGGVGLEISAWKGAV
jgi:PAS domain S-box-containing protein